MSHKNHRIELRASLSGLDWTVIDARGKILHACKTKAEALAIADKSEGHAPKRVSKGPRVEYAPRKEHRRRKAKPVKTTGAKNKFRIDGFAVVIGRRIRRRRKELGLTMVQLCARGSCVSRGYLDQLENGACSPSIGALYAIASALETTVCELLAEDAVVDELDRLRAIERRCIAHLDDCQLKAVLNRPWQEVRQ